jgi:hypothetical protein
MDSSNTCVNHHKIVNQGIVGVKSTSTYTVSKKS